MVKSIQNTLLKKILILAYSFPPVGGGRVRRVIKFVKYLPSLNWQPIVLTVKKPRVNEYDHMLLHQLPDDLAVIRTQSLEFFNLYHVYKKKDTTTGQKKFFKRIFDTLILHILRKIKNWICIPDSRIGWIPFAVFRGLRIIKKNKIDIIMVIAEPFSSFISGVILKYISHKPLVLDFRDEWSEYNKYIFLEKGVFAKRIEKLLEAICVWYADIVVSVTEGIITNFQKRYPQYNKNKFICITNGFDPDDFKDISEVSRKRENFIISYGGLLCDFRSPEVFFNAVSELIEEKSELSNILRLHFMGEFNKEADYLFEDKRIKMVTKKYGFLNYAETLNKLKNSDILLYIEDDVEIAYRFMPAKIFEYMGIKKPVLALVRNGAVKDIITRARIGLVADPKNIGEIKNALYTLYDLYYKRKEKFEPDEDFIQRFYRKNLTVKLAGVLNTLVR